MEESPEVRLRTLRIGFVGAVSGASRAEKAPLDLGHRPLRQRVPGWSWCMWEWDTITVGSVRFENIGTDLDLLLLQRTVTQA